MSDSRNRMWGWALFAFVAAGEFALGYYIAVTVGFMHSDAISRVANAYYVLYSRDPHLAAIGFVWNPLPSLLELIPLLFNPLYPKLASHGVASVILTSIFAGMTASLLFRACRRFELSLPMAVMFALLYSVNPMIVLFGANGLSDVPYIYFLMLTVVQFCYWLKDKHISNAIWAGFALSLAFWVRYEAVPFGFSLAVSVAIALYIANRTSRLPGKELYWKIESTWLLLLLPAAFSGLLWIFMNYTIMGNPLYFLNSEYANASQSSLKTSTNFQELFASPTLIFQLVIQKTSWYSMPLLAILLVRAFTHRLFRWDTAILLALFAAVPGLQLLLLFNGSSFGWFRYFLYVLPVTVAWIPYELSQLGAKVRRAAFAAIAASLLLTAGMIGYAMTQPDIAPDENTFLTLRSGGGKAFFDRQQTDRAVAAWIDANTTDKDTILTDSASAYAVLVNSKHPKRFLITSDLAFKKALKDPVAGGVDYVLVPKPADLTQSAVNVLYPQLYAEGSDWARLVRDFNDQWRLYRVSPSRSE